MADPRDDVTVLSSRQMDAPYDAARRSLPRPEGRAFDHIRDVLERPGDGSLEDCRGRLLSIRQIVGF